MSGEDWGNDFFDVLDREKESQKEKLEPPKNYHVFILNDDYSTFEMVIAILMRYFGHTAARAERTARDVHTKGKGLAGTYPKDIAETKAAIVAEIASQEEMPLRATVEQE